MKTRILALALCLFLLIGLLPVTAFAVTTITKVDIVLDEPVAGEKPPTSAACNGSGYRIYSIDWEDTTEGRFLSAGEKFQAGHRYSATLWVEARSGYEFANRSDLEPNVSCTVNGKSCRADKAFEYKAFAMINITYAFGAVEAPPAPHTHTPSDWRTTQIYHYQVCTTCGDMLTSEDHLGGTATCAEKGVCTVCGFAYIEENENHTPDTSKWVARVDMYHFHACKDCGAHCDIEDHRWSPTYLYQDSTGHAWICADCKATSAIEKHNPGPAATEKTPQTCKDCGYVIAPVANHRHELTKVPQTPATCLEEGNIEYYRCAGCSDRFTDDQGKNKIPETMSIQVGALGHTASDTWAQDDRYHWRTCTVCQAVLDETKMLHEDENGKCATCAYEPGAAVTTPATEPPIETPTEPPTPPKNNGWVAIVLVALVCFAAAITTTVIVLKMKKKGGPS